MEASNLDASELSARTGISVSYLTRILRGEVANPTIDFVIRLAAGLGVTETELLREGVGGQPAAQKPEAISPSLPGIVQSGLRLPAVRLSARGQEIDRRLAAAGLTEVQKEKVFAALVEIVPTLIKLQYEK